jgi:amidase
VAAGGEPVLPHIQAFIDRAPPISVLEYWQLNKRKVAAQRAYQTMWSNMRSKSDHSVDLLLLPTMPHTALPHRCSSRWVGYTKLFNFLDYTALSFPAGRASKDLDDRCSEASIYQPRNSNDAWNWGHYDIEMMDGLEDLRLFRRKQAGVGIRKRCDPRFEIRPDIFSSSLL